MYLKDSKMKIRSNECVINNKVSNNKMDQEEDDKRKYSTLNSMYISSTIAKPCTDSIIQAVATILHSQMLEVRINQPFHNEISNHFPHFRIKTRIGRSLKTLISFSFQKRSTSWKSPRPLISRESNY